VPGGRLYLLILGAGEIVSILVRKHNAGVLSDAYFGQALANFEAEIVRPADITKVPVTSRLVTASLPLIVAHAINSTDALILKSALAIARKLRSAGKIWCWSPRTSEFSELLRRKAWSRSTRTPSRKQPLQRSWPASL
jgi:hypothetical protein